MIWLGFTMPCYEIREWFHTQVEVLYPRISLYSVLGILGDVHIQACLFWVMPSQMMANSIPHLSVHPCIQDPREGFKELVLLKLLT